MLKTEKQEITPQNILAYKRSHLGHITECDLKSKIIFITRNKNRVEYYTVPNKLRGNSNNILKDKINIFKTTKDVNMLNVIKICKTILS